MAKNRLSDPSETPEQKISRSIMLAREILPYCLFGLSFPNTVLFDYLFDCLLDLCEFLQA